MDSLFALLVLPVTALIIIFIVRYVRCIQEYRYESEILKRKIRRAADESSANHWKKRLACEKWLLMPFAGRYIRNHKLKKYSGAKMKRY